VPDLVRIPISTLSQYTVKYKGDSGGSLRMNSTTVCSLNTSGRPAHAITAERKRVILIFRATSR
jgi:hypothetical protein